MRPFFVRCAIVVLLLALAAPGATGQEPPPSAESTAPAPESSVPTVDREAVQALIEDLRDSEARERLIQRLEVLLAAQQPEKPAKPAPGAMTRKLAPWWSQHITEPMRQLQAQLGTTGDWLANIPRGDAGMELPAAPWLEHGGLALAALALALALAALTAWALRKPRRKLAARPGAGVGAHSLISGGLILLGLMPVGVFYAVSIVVLGALDTVASVGFAAGRLTLVLAVLSALWIVGSELLAPAAPRAPIAGISSRGGRACLRWLWLLGLLIGGGAVLHAVVSVLGAPEAVLSVLIKLIGLLAIVAVAVLGLRYRRGVVVWLQGHEPSAARSMLAGMWHLPVLALLIVGAGALLLGGPDSMGYLARVLVITLAVLLAARWLAALARQVVSSAGDALLGGEDSPPELRRRTDRYVRGASTLVAWVVWALALLVVVDAWGVPSLEWLASTGGRELGGRVLTIVVVVVTGLLASEIAGGLVETTLRRQGAVGTAQSARVMTLLPLLRNLIRVLIGVVVLMVALAELGVNIAPLIAGAGVVGLAIGFGAQSLVQDLITGFFILLEDSIAVGDFVEVGAHSGTVERLSIRTVRLRDLSGNVHVVPFSQFSTVLNYTKEFAHAVIDIGVAYREDTDEVTAVLQDVGAALAEDSDYGTSILEPMEVFGVNAFADSAVEIRVRFKCAPGHQWRVKREFLRRVKQAFDQRGIEIPFPHRTLYFGVDRDSEAPPGQIRLDRGDAPA